MSILAKIYLSFVIILMACTAVLIYWPPYTFYTWLILSVLAVIWIAASSEVKPDKP